MNKLLVFPLALMFIISILVWLETSVQPEGTSEDYSNSSGITINATDGGEADVQIPKAGTQTFNIWNQATGVMVIYLAAVAISIVAGIKVLGSGFSELSQNMIFVSIVFLGLWACLTIVASSMFFGDTFGTVTWLSLTMMFMLGLTFHLGGSDEN